MGIQLLDSKEKTGFFSGEIPEKLSLQKNQKNPKLTGLTLYNFRSFQSNTLKTFDYDVLRR